MRALSLLAVPLLACSGGSSRQRHAERSGEPAWTAVVAPAAVAAAVALPSQKSSQSTVTSARSTSGSGERMPRLWYMQLSVILPYLVLLSSYAAA